MRVVYEDPITKEKTHKVMSRKEALAFAKSLKLDLILGERLSTVVVRVMRESVFIFVVLCRNGLTHTQSTGR